MGQLNVVLELSRFANLICIGVFLLIAISSVNGNAQVEYGNCIFKTENRTVVEGHSFIIEGNSISEKTAPDTIIWNVPTENIKSSVSSYHAHARYLTGQRYTSRYVYLASSHFPDFIDVELPTTILRFVRFTCANNIDIDVEFQFPLIDENDAPVFLQIPTNELSVRVGHTDEINSSPIIVWDKDFTDDFNDVTVTTDRSDVFQVSRSNVERPSRGKGKDYHIYLKLNSENASIRPGLYNINLFASDGRLSASAELGIRITSS